jgi:hypothetical protein
MRQANEPSSAPAPAASGKLVLLVMGSGALLVAGAVAMFAFLTRDEGVARLPPDASPSAAVGGPIGSAYPRE